MEAARWARVTDLYHAAIARPPTERASFLGNECDGDENLRRQVEAMVRSHELSGDFIELPAFAVAPELLVNEPAGDLIGQSIGCYQVESLLGAGGMGEVYLARDERLARKVALKLLPEHLTADETQLSRLKTEARTASALNHPNILTVYEIGADGNRHFIATEFIEGVTLRTLLSRERMNLHDVLEVAIQVASALAAAHKAGVIHRDIKPGNIMVRHDGYVKVLDFGIAKLAQSESMARLPNDPQLLATQTNFGSTMGTLGYMSPEQVRGEAVDQRTDIWSFGVVLYEMVAGVRPFSGTTPAEIIQSIQQVTPAPAVGSADSVSKELQQIIYKALEKNRERRFAHIDDMLESLKKLRRKLELPRESSGNTWLTNARRAPAVVALILVAVSIAVFTFIHSRALRSATSVPKSIAVLPLDDRGASESDRYFADGIQHELISQLSRIEDFKVISQGSTQHYQHGKRNLVEIAKQLGVTYLLEGSVERTGNGIRLETHLTNAPAETQLWTATYNRPLTDIFAVESEITTNVAGTLKIRVSGDDAHAFASTPTQSSEAHELYLRGHYLAAKRHEQDMKKAIDFYEQAIEKDPTYALAYAGLAEAYVLLSSWGNETPLQQCYAIAKANAQKSLAIDATLPEAHVGLALAVAHQTRDFTRAREELERAIELAPNSASAHYYLGYLVDAAEGDFDHAIPEMKRAVALDPLSPIVNANFGFCYLLARRYPEGLAQLEKTVKSDPTAFFAYDGLGWALELTGRLDEAIETWKKGYSIGHHHHSLAALAYGYAMKGDREQALKVVAQLRDLEQHGTGVWPLGHAYIELALGNRQEAIAWLERGAAENDSTILNYIKTLPPLDPLRGDRRFERLVNEIVPPKGGGRLGAH
jgi:serine/threonine protein kinase/tetratricopeptide (TPR) repeat protein